jgi:hypothetical protein
MKYFKYFDIVESFVIILMAILMFILGFVTGAGHSEQRMVDQKAAIWVMNPATGNKTLQYYYRNITN